MQHISMHPIIRSITSALFDYILVLQTVEEEKVEEDSLGEELGVDDDDGTSVFSDNPNYEGAEVWDEVLAAIHLMQEGWTSSKLD